jgi:hypothetical protein
MIPMLGWKEGLGGMNNTPMGMQSTTVSERRSGGHLKIEEE